MLGVALVVAAAAFGYSKSQDRQYTATARLFISAQAGSTATDLLQSSTFTQQRVKSYASVVTTRAVVAPVAVRFGVSVKRLTANITSTAPLDTVLINISVNDTSAARAALLANALGAQFRRVVTTLEIPAVRGGSAVRVTQVQGATPPDSPSAPKTRTNTILGLLVGLVLGWALVVARDLLDTRVRAPQDLEALVDAPVLGTTTQLKRTTESAAPASGHPASAHAEAYRQVRTNLQFLSIDNPPKVIAVTSAIAGEGKSTVATNTATALSETGASVVLVDADLRRPAAARYLELSAATGLTSVLRGDVSLDEALIPWESGTLRVLPSGPIPPNPSELLGSEAMARILAELRESFDYVVVDTPPVLPVTDAVVVSTRVDGIIIVCRATRVRRAQVSEAVERLTTVGANVIGVVLAGMKTRGPDAYRYYYGEYKADTAS